MKRVIVYHAKKHPSIATMLLVAGAVLLLAICGYVLVRPILGGQDGGTLALSPHELMVRNNVVSYPTLGKEKADALIKEYASKQSDTFVDSIKNGSYDPRNKLIVEYTLLHRGQRTTTVLFTKQERRANQPTMLSHHTMSVDLEAQKEMAATDLFKPDVDAGSSVGMLLYDYFKQEAPDSLTPAQFFALLQLKPEHMHGVWLDSSALRFTVNPQNLPASDGQRSFAVNRSLLADVLKPEYATDDPGEGKPPAVEYAITAKPRPGDTIDPNQKMLALTFDDGPGSLTARVLDALKRVRAHGTFFVIGQQVPGKADVIRRMVNEGSEVGNHSWSHPSLPSLPPERLQQEIGDTQRAIQNVADGYTPTQMRPPYGAVNEAVTAYLHSQGLKVALWNVDTEDWRYRDAALMYDRIMGAAADGRVILLHDIHPTSVEAAERAIPDLVAQGYQLVTMSQLERHR